MMSKRTSGILGLAVLALAAATPASAQKSKDTLRYPIQDVHTVMDTYIDPGRVNQMWAASVYDYLFGFDPVQNRYMPMLAKSWTQPSPTVYELELRDDIKFHDGEQFDA